MKITVGKHLQDISQEAGQLLSRFDGPHCLEQEMKTACQRSIASLSYETEHTFSSYVLVVPEGLSARLRQEIDEADYNVRRLLLLYNGRFLIAWILAIGFCCCRRLLLACCDIENDSGCR